MFCDKHRQHNDTSFKVENEINLFLNVYAKLPTLLVLEISSEVADYKSIPPVLAQ